MTALAMDLVAPELQLAFNDRRYTLQQLARLLQGLDELWVTCRDLEYMDFPRWEPGITVLPLLQPRVQIVRLESPLWLELLFPGAGAGAGGTAVYILAKILKDPSSVAEWLPTVVERWHLRWAAAERAKLEHAQAHRDRLRGLSLHAKAQAGAIDRDHSRRG